MSLYVGIDGEEKMLLSVKDAAEMLGISERNVKYIISRGELLSVKIGDRRLVPTRAVRDYVATLIRNAAK